MKKKKLGLSLICVAIAGTMSVNFVGCQSNTSTIDLMDGITANSVEGKAADDKFTSAYADFAVKLFEKSVDKNDNSLISPLSVMLALSMTANGADGETKAEMEKVLGGDIPLDDLNEYLYAYVKSLPCSDNSKISIANSIWYRDDENRLKIKPDFLQNNADYYGADAFKAPFNEQTLNDINNWVSDNTDGMIDKMLDKIDPNEIMYLINALVFDALWEEEYDDYSVIDDTFTNYDGSKSKVEMMTSVENKYIEEESFTGFIKDYKDGKYSFAAFLPNSDVDIDDFVSSLSGQELVKVLKNVYDCDVDVKLPKFSFDYSIEMKDVLQELGIKEAFDYSKADFSKMAESENGNIFIGGVLHKTHITVDEGGTKAAASTMVSMCDGAALIEDIYKVQVELVRPFVFMIIDNSTSLPVFIGEVKNISETEN